MSHNHIIDTCWYKMSNRCTPGFIANVFGKIILLTLSSVTDDDKYQIYITRLCVIIDRNDCFINACYVMNFRQEE